MTVFAAPHRSSQGVRIEDSVSVHVLQFVHADGLDLLGCTVGSNRPGLV